LIGWNPNECAVEASRVDTQELSRSVENTQTVDPRDVWNNPLATRYASAEMTAVWSDRNRYRLWRQVWLALAEAEAELGLPITEAQLKAMRDAIEPVDFEQAASYEKQMRHDPRHGRSSISERPARLSRTMRI
jgi:hypothetical protein